MFFITEFDIFLCFFRVDKPNICSHTMFCFLIFNFFKSQQCLLRACERKVRQEMFSQLQTSVPDVQSYMNLSSTGGLGHRCRVFQGKVQQSTARQDEARISQQRNEQAMKCLSAPLRNYRGERAQL